MTILGSTIFPHSVSVYKTDHMRKLIFKLILIALLFSCQNDDCVETTPDPLLDCFNNYKPVCGCNGKTYRNSCLASVYGITEYVEGECP